MYDRKPYPTLLLFFLLIKNLKIYFYNLSRSRCDSLFRDVEVNFYTSMLLKKKYQNFTIKCLVVQQSLVNVFLMEHNKISTIGSLLISYISKNMNVKKLYTTPDKI